MTVTLKLPLEELPLKSAAEQFTVVAPRGKVDPEAGTQVTGTEPSTASDAEAVKFTTAPAELEACTMMLAGRVKTGGVVSLEGEIGRAHV